MAAKSNFSGNPVKVAVEKAGGIVKVAYLCEVTTTTVYNWIRAGRVESARHAVTLAEEAGIDVKEIAG